MTLSASGQDTIDALFWTATEPRGKKREHIGIIPHVLLAVGYVFLHSMLVLLQVSSSLDSPRAPPVLSEVTQPGLA